MTSSPLAGSPIRNLRRLMTDRPAPVVGERCDMCAEPIADDHPHVVNLESRALMCTCRACYLLFTDENADLHYRAVPDRYLSFPDVSLDARSYDELEIPVGLAFLFSSSVLGRTVAFYPGPAGAIESELPLGEWEQIVESNPSLAVLRADVEALLLRAHPGGDNFSCHLVPIDACYALVGRLRQVWRGFDGGTEAHQAMEDFFADVASRSRPAPTHRESKGPESHGGDEVAQ